MTGVALLVAALSATASVEPRSAEVGEEVVVTVTAVGSGLSRASIEAPPAPAGVEIGPAQGPSLQRRFESINGRQSRSEQLVWQFETRATRAGRYVLPPFTVANGSETAATSPVVFHAVGEFDPDDYVFVETRLDARPRFAGEPIAVELVVGIADPWIDRLVDGETSIDAPWIVDGLGASAPAAAGPLPRAGTPGAMEIRLASGGKLAMTRATEDRDGTEFHVFRARQRLVPGRSGRLTIPAARLRAVIATQVTRGGWFDDRLVAARTRLALVATQPVEIDVRPLPADGEPADFTGLVGRLELAASAAPARLRVGDSLKLRVRLSGEGNLFGTPLPRWDLPGFKRFGVVEEVDGDAELPARTLVYDLSPASTEVGEIPALRLPVFDTTVAAYRVLTTEPIPLVVEPAATASDGAAAPGGTEAAGATAAPDGGARDRASRVATWAVEAGSRIPPSAIAAAFATPLALALGWRAATRRRSAARARPRRARHEFARALRRLAAADSPAFASLGSALTTYLADLADVPPATFVGIDLEAGLSPWIADAALRARVVRLFAAAEGAAFGGTLVGWDDLLRQAAELARPVERAMRRATVAADRQPFPP